MKRKKCDLIVANNVASSENIMGGDMNSAHIYSNSNLVAKYQSMKKVDLSKKLLTEIIHPLLHKKIGENTL